jgi:putative transposase
MDNYATHKHAKVRAWLAQHPRFHVHYTPTYASWLNQVERWFGIITQRAIRRGSFSSVKELIARIEQFVAAYNKKTAQFIWTATADSIPEKLQRLCS